MKGYYHLSAGVLCGICHYAMYPDGAFLLEEPIALKPMPMRFKCMNEKCPQHSTPIEIPPVEVEIA